MHLPQPSWSNLPFLFFFILLELAKGKSVLFFSVQLANGILYEKMLGIKNIISLYNRIIILHKIINNYYRV